MWLRAGWLSCDSPADVHVERKSLVPIIRIELIEGRTPELKEELIRRVTDAVMTTLAVQPP
jgi:hypothetical protein